MGVGLWQELRRRKVFRTAGLYVVGAWLIIQVGDVFFPAWGLPETALRYLFIAAAACFPVALVFGWYYDITAQGIVRTERADDREAVDLRLSKIDYVILLAMFGIALAVLVGSFGKIQEEIETVGGYTTGIERVPNSVAVLPFANLDTNPDTGYFSDGVTEEILQRLSMLRAIHVLAHTSSFAFRNSDEGPAGIAEKLGVLYLLQGSVRRDADRVRVTARLLDANGFQVWSDTFDRRLESIFVIQTEIAAAVSSQIANEIIPSQELPAGRTTENMEAYNEYLRGRAFFDSRVAGWKQQAKAAFNRAIELDPEYAPPYAGLATLVVNSNRGLHWEEARDSARKSLQLDPELPLGHATLGLTLTILGEHQLSVESLRRATELDPSLAIAYEWIGMPLTELGLEEEARAMRERGLEVDPLNPTSLRNAAERESRLGNFDRAEQLLLRLKDLPEPPHFVLWTLVALNDSWGRFADAIEIAKVTMRNEISEGREPEFGGLALAYAKLGMTDEADYWFEEFRSRWSYADPPIDITLSLAQQDADLPWLSADLAQAEELLASATAGDEIYLLSYGGLAWIQAGDPVKGIDWLERGILMSQQIYAEDNPPERVDYSLLVENWRYHYVTLVAARLAFAYGAVGQNELAEDAMRFLERDYQGTVNMSGPWILERRALTRVLSGDSSAALDNLRQAVAFGWADYYRVVNDPVWAETIHRPEFRTLLAEVRSNIERQRAIVEEIEATHDFRAEVRQLLSVQSETR